METLSKYFSTILVLVIAILIMTNINYCNTSKDIVHSDTVEIVKHDTTYIEISGSKESNPKVITVRDTINKYITKDTVCNRIHLNEKGIDLIKYREYQDTVNIKGYYVSYDMALIGKLQTINLNLYGNVPKIKETRLKTITNTKYQKNSIGFYAGFNNTAYLGVEYQNNEFGYGINYDLQNKSIGVQLSYTPFRW